MCLLASWAVLAQYLGAGHRFLEYSKWLLTLNVPTTEYVPWIELEIGFKVDFESFFKKQEAHSSGKWTEAARMLSVIKLGYCELPTSFYSKIRSLKTGYAHQLKNDFLGQTAKCFFCRGDRSSVGVLLPQFPTFINVNERVVFIELASRLTMSLLTRNREFISHATQATNRS